MENINLSTTGDRHTTTILSAIPVPLVIIGNWQTHLPLASATTSISHWHQSPASAIGIYQSPSLDLATSCYSTIGTNPYRQFL